MQNLNVVQFGSWKETKVMKKLKKPLKSIAKVSLYLVNAESSCCTIW